MLIEIHILKTLHEPNHEYDIITAGTSAVLKTTDGNDTVISLRGVYEQFYEDESVEKNVARDALCFKGDKLLQHALAAFVENKTQSIDFTVKNLLI